MIRRIIAPDADLLARLAALHDEAFGDTDRGWTSAEIASLTKTGILIADEEGRGFSLLSQAADEAEILTITVSAAHRRSGVGRALLDAALREAAAAGASQMFLEVAEDNAPARALYAAAGFSEAGRRKNYYARRQRKVEAIVLSRALP